MGESVLSLNSLLEEGKKEGKVTTSQIYNLFDKEILDIDALTEFIEALKSNDIKIEKEMLSFYDEEKNEDDSANLYLTELEKIVPLSSDVEDEVYQKTKLGNSFAREKLINSNLSFAINVASRYIGKGIPFIDLIQDASLGFMRALNDFQCESFGEMIVYALWYMESDIKFAIDEYERLSKIPIQMVERMREVNRTFHVLLNKNGKAPSASEVAKELAIETEKVEEILQMAQQSKMPSHSHDEDEEENI